MKKRILSTFAFAIIACSASVEAQTVRAGIDFDGADDAVVIPHISAYNFGTGPVTMEMWIQADASQAYNPHILHKKDTSTNATGFAVALNNSGKINIELRGNGYSTGFGGGSGSGLDDGNCHHIAFHRDNTGAADTIRIFVDGKLLRKSVKAIQPADISYSAPIYVGWVSGGFGKEDFPFAGIVKEVRMWNTVRTEAQIADKMDKFLKGNEPGLVGYWRMNDNSGTTVKDYSNNGNNGAFWTGSRAPAWKDFCDVINDVLPPPPTGIEEINVAEVMAYPNPASQVLNFKIESNRDIASIQVMNQLGARVITQQVANNRIDIAELPTGIYFYEVSLTDNTVLKGRFIKE